MATKIASGLVHPVPSDLKKILIAAPKVLEKWNDLTPLARNEWICWITSVKKIETRADHIRRIQEDLLKGKRRPCCWIGCIHRTDKSPSASQKFVTSRGTKK